MFKIDGAVLLKYVKLKAKYKSLWFAESNTNCRFNTKNNNTKG